LLRPGEGYGRARGGGLLPALPGFVRRGHGAGGRHRLPLDRGARRTHRPGDRARARHAGAHPPSPQGHAAGGGTPGREGARRRRTPVNKILIVEDEKSMRDVLTLTLRKEGYKVDTADSAVAARERMEKDPGFDLVITDISMPGGMTGLDLLRHSRRHHPDAAVVL